MEIEDEPKQNGQPPEIEVKARTADIQVAEEFNFSKFMLSDQLLGSLNRMNFIKPSPIQLKVIPLAKCGHDLILQAKSGTGKTLAFAICLLETYDVSLVFPQSLVIVPTREIAVQIVGVLNELGKNIRRFKACEFIGGTEFTNDRKKIQSARVVVGTPGRILHLIRSEVFNILNLRTLVLDEADKLLEGGHMGKDVKEILKLMNSKIQIIAATATVTDHLEKFLKHAMKNPIGITPKHEIPVLLGIKQFVRVLHKEDSVIAQMNQKIEELDKIFQRIPFKQCMLFTDSQSKSESYGIYLNKKGWKNQVINASQDQAERLKVLDNLVKFKCRILIATDLMARGIDIDNVNLIINLDLPNDCFTYLHRIGRAGRFGSHGVAITLVNSEDDVAKFQKMLGDIGGESLKAMMYPDESVDYDFWDFEENNGTKLETVSGISKNGDSEDSSVEDNESAPEDIVMNNIALLEITRKLVDDKNNPDTEKFDLEAMLEDYEKFSGVPDAVEPEIQSEMEVSEDERLNGQANGHDENIFLKAIEDMNLYSDDDEIPSDDANKNGIALEEAKSPPSPKEVRKVIFCRPSTEGDGELLTSESEVEEDSEMEDSEIDADEESSDSDIEDTPEVNEEKPMNNKEASKKPSSGHRTRHGNQSQDNPYSEYVASYYQRWQHMYQFQLAEIQSHAASARK